MGRKTVNILLNSGKLHEVSSHVITHESHSLTFLFTSFMVFVFFLKILFDCSFRSGKVLQIDPFRPSKEYKQKKDPNIQFDLT